MRRLNLILKRMIVVGFSISLLLMGGCQKIEEEPIQTKTDVVTLKSVILGTEPECGMEGIYEQLDELTIAELGCRVRFDFIPWGNEREQLNIAAASGEYDILPNGNFSDYKQLVEKNAFEDLNQYLEYAPELVEHYKTYPALSMEDCEINGGLYGIPQYNAGVIQYDSEGFFYREDLRKKWGLEEITDLDSMEAYLYKAKAEQYKDEPLITDNRIWQALWIMLASDNYVEVGSIQETPFVVVDASQPDVILNRLETPEFKVILEYIHKWYQDGILESDMLTLSDNEATRGLVLMDMDKKPCETNIPIWSINAACIRQLTEHHPEWEYGFFPYITMRGSYYMGSLKDVSVMSISSKCKYPQMAIAFLEKIHTDSRYYDLLHYGVEGVNYHLIDDKVSYEGVPVSNRFCITVLGDAVLDREELPVNQQFYQDATLKFDKWRDEILPDCKTSPLVNFSYSTATLSDNLSLLTEAKLKYFQPLVCGYDEDIDAGLANCIEALNAAGLPEYMEELGRQLNSN